MQDQRDHRHDQQNVDQAAGNVKYAPAQDPGHQQNDEQNGKDTHNHLRIRGLQQFERSSRRGVALSLEQSFRRQHCGPEMHPNYLHESF